MLRLHPFALIILVMPLKAVEKAVMNNGLDKKHGQYFCTYMVVLDTLSSFVLMPLEVLSFQSDTIISTCEKFWL